SDLFVSPYVDGTQSAAVKTALGFGLPVVVTDVITDALIEMLPERCKVVPAGDAMSLADGIVAQINVSAQDPDQIQRVIDQSWAQMMLTITGYLVRIQNLPK
ncbi:MAG: hypothetical protein GX142_03305, partial [Chloroflexi bacterium]|nr:hypothetical protein [Chloroflexota bacterium]